MQSITESAIEQLNIEKLEVLGYQYLYSPVIAADYFIIPKRVKAAISGTSLTAHNNCGRTFRLQYFIPVIAKYQPDIKQIFPMISPRYSHDKPMMLP